MAGASETLLSGGQRSAAVAAAALSMTRASRNYREVVLPLSRMSKISWPACRVFGQQIGVEQAAVQAAERVVQITLNEYQTVAYTSVLTAQTTLLSDQQTALQVQENRYAGQVGLVAALGGGWDTSQLPTRHDLQAFV